MNIGIDVDGTLIDISAFMIENGEAYFHRAPSDKSGFDVDQIFACSHDERNGFWKKNLLRYCTRSPIIDGAAETIARFRSDGHKIFIITSRVFATKKGVIGAWFRGMLKRWLVRNGVVYDDIVFCEDSGESKLENCRKFDVDIMIDDKPENLLLISEKHAVIACPMPWNEEISEQGIVRAKDWAEIYDLVNGGPESLK